MPTLSIFFGMFDWLFATARRAAQETCLLRWPTAAMVPAFPAESGSLLSRR